MARVWIVSELYYPEASSTGRVLTNIAQGLAAEFEVCALCAQPTYDARGATAPRQEQHKGVSIFRIASTRFDKNRLIGRAINAASITASMFAAALRLFKRGDVVVAVTNPPTTPFLIALAARLKGARFILLVHDTYPDVLNVVGMMRESHPVYRLWQAANRRLLKRASALVALGRDAKKRWAAYGDSGRTVIIPNYSEPDLIQPLPRQGNPMLERLGIKDRFVIQYAGNMGRTHDLESVAEGCRILAKTDPHIQFVFIGNGAKQSVLEQAAKDCPNTVMVMEYQKREGLSEVLTACDWALISLGRGMAGISVPSRMYNVFCSGRPLLAVADEDTELAMAVRDSSLGIVAPPGDPEAFAAAVRQAAAAPADSALVDRARQAAEATRLEAVVEAYAAMLRPLVKG